MEDKHLRSLFEELEQDYRDLKGKGAKTIDIDMIINDLVRYRM